VEAAASWDSGWRVSAVRSDGTRDVFWSDADTLNATVHPAPAMNVTISKDR
jgi:hypothetical protein